MTQLEIEVKFTIQDIECIRQRIIKLGALAKKRHFEQNYLFDNTSRSLCELKSVLRLRKTEDNTTITYKSIPKLENAHLTTQYKIRNEYETNVSNFDHMSLILNGLGFHVIQQYEKWRQAFIADGVTFTVDELPYGCFLEIEGQIHQIEIMASKLGLLWENRILLNYIELFEIIKKHNHLSITYLTFDQFKGIAINLDSIHKEIVAG
ncbi:MAG: class IV adenylate cyclase [Desulfobacterales bacterium]|nr:class IV adenylate cyclase [Desulfobacterales bacterium]